jgi:DNA invertase Pin-like site-specific DNA recombinase
MTKYIAYYRVSTAKQGKSGLGLEAQEHTTTNYVKRVNGALIGSFMDVESGSKNNRPELQKALRECRLTGGTLLIAKLDRLSRNRRFLMDLQDSSITFVCCDMPEANNFTVGLLACLADYERELISERTKAALKAAKARGVKLGNPNLHLVRNTDTAAASKALSQAAQKRNSELRQVVNEIRGSVSDPMSLRQIASHLNDAGYTTARGSEFKATTVSRILAARE